MAKIRKSNGIRTFRRQNNGLTISLMGNIKPTFELKNILKKSDNQIESDFATLTLQHSNKKTNYYTTFNLEQKDFAGKITEDGMMIRGVKILRLVCIESAESPMRLEFFENLFSVNQIFAGLHRTWGFGETYALGNQSENNELLKVSVGNPNSYLACIGLLEIEIPYEPIVHGTLEIDQPEPWDMLVIRIIEGLIQIIKDFFTVVINGSNGFGHPDYDGKVQELGFLVSSASFLYNISKNK
ncbi:18253_t:CDS:2 [Cetraspora pellucida]|uniref:18253_t:CDS:1 n=1 Tax=Cetraspora pellucida TaxID=1433469 RepID=A0ACA9KA60_9GLOM|nr:18253_t:CDS:2 [Cetraspora pellucida]